MDNSHLWPAIDLICLEKHNILHQIDLTKVYSKRLTCQFKSTEPFYLLLLVLVMELAKN